MKRIRLSLTGIGETLKKEVVDKLKASTPEKKEYGEPRCSNGHTVEFYEDLNVEIPQDLKDKLESADTPNVVIKEDDWEETYSHIVVYEDEIKFMVTDDELTTIFLKDDMSLTVLETAEEIDDYLDYMHRTTFEKIIDYIKYKLTKTNKND